MKSLLFFILVFAIATSSFSQIKLHPKNPHYFEFQGKSTILMTSAEHYGSVINLDFDYKTYLNTLQKDALNYTRLFVGTYREAFGGGDFSIPRNTLGPETNKFITPWERSTTSGYFYGGNKFNLEKWNQQYFARLKDFIQQADLRKIVVEITLFTAHYSSDGWKSSPFHQQSNINNVDSVAKSNSQTLNNGNILAYQEKMVRKFVQELNGFDNIFFEIQNEPWAEKGVIVNDFVIQKDYIQPDAVQWHKIVEIANNDNLAWQKKVAEWIVDEELKLPKKHLIAQGISNFYYEIPENIPNISIYNFHYAHARAAYNNMQLNKVIGYDESGFNGKSDEVYRQQAWQFMLSGGGLCNNLDYSFTAQKPNGTDLQKAPGGGGVNIRKHYGILKKFIESFDFVEMKPLNNAAVVDDSTASVSILALEGQQYAVYLVGKNKPSVDFQVPAGVYLEKWIDVKTGKVLRSVIKNHQNEVNFIKVTAVSGEIAAKIIRIEKQRKLKPD